MAHYDVPHVDQHYLQINSTELRKAKTVYNLGLSECNRVKLFLFWGLVKGLKNVL